MSDTNPYEIPIASSRNTAANILARLFRVPPEFVNPDIGDFVDAIIAAAVYRSKTCRKSGLNWIPRGVNDPRGGRILAFSPSYPAGHEMRYRMMDARFFVTAGAATHWCDIENNDPEL